MRQQDCEEEREEFHKSIPFVVIQNTKQHRGMAMEFLFWNKLDVSLVIFSVKYKDTNGNSRQKKPRKNNRTNK